MDCIEKNQKLFLNLIPPNRCFVSEPLTKVHIVTLSYIREDIKSYRTTGKECNDPYMRLAISIAAKAVIFPKDVKMLHLSDFFKQDLPIWSGSPGLPWTQMGYKTKGSIRDDINAVNRFRLFWHQIKLDKPMPKLDCLEFVPAQLVQEGEVKSASRLVLSSHHGLR
ncbi:uncharacterized protein LOC117176854 [Belonocnema kinseyi]|uniref:uncharacterized protein LOC117176854 n=1 Tax=Belonocnema kinseyi TaxID=2817044 RepID=UPI00143D192B|nr:uncharacterized protein LOC117176854 [Belonocnema kinseyi]XP_033223090.1 uncharacterized protein LOC117176854 [Belonocnema kinseyi]